MPFFIILGIVILIIVVVKVSKNSNDYSANTSHTASTNFSSNTSANLGIAQNHPASMLYNLTCQCFKEKNCPLVMSSQDIVNEVKDQYRLSDQYRNKIQSFFNHYPEYQQRLKTHIVKFGDQLYALSFVLEVICISRSKVARKMLLKSNFVYQTAFGDLIALPFIKADADELSNLSEQEKDEIFIDVVDQLKQHLNSTDLEFIEHIETVLFDINKQYGEICLEFKGFDNFDDNESQYPAITSYINIDEMKNYRYNYSNELMNTYYYFSVNEKTYNLRIRNILETLDMYIEMCTRYKVYETCRTYIRIYTRNFEELGNTNFQNIIKNKMGENYTNAIDQCLLVMCKSNRN